MAKRTNLPQRPRLGSDLALAQDVLGADDVELVQLTVQGDYSGQRFAGLTADESHFLHASFVGADLRGARLVDVLVDGSDFSGADLEEASLSRVEFVGCRMSGAQIAQSRMEDVTFTECKLDDANFRMCAADRILFDHVNLRGAEFSAAHLVGASFFDCDATGAEFSQVVMPGARFHGSSLADIKGGQSIRDIVIDSAQVLPLALRVFADLGIRIADERDTPDE
ncbi:MAG TPA: pentapeptide repeat-containing protein [Acidimicrobiales bacterium]|jgi:uncharacterized protein YjbI with pentapeptide repeats|nr:pentapeptide repeat-containing protein [Acidimicrobiales bacterium]